MEGRKEGREMGWACSLGENSLHGGTDGAAKKELKLGKKRTYAHAKAESSLVVVATASLSESGARFTPTLLSPYYVYYTMCVRASVIHNK